MPFSIKRQFILPQSVGTPLYKRYRYVPSQRIWFLSCFGLKMGIALAHFGLESGMVFKETTGVYECVYRMNKKEREINANSKWILSNLFCWLFNLNNNDMTS